MSPSVAKPQQQAPCRSSHEALLRGLTAGNAAQTWRPSCHALNHPCIPLRTHSSPRLNKGGAPERGHSPPQAGLLWEQLRRRDSPSARLSLPEAHSAERHLSFQVLLPTAQVSARHYAWRHPAICCFPSSYPPPTGISPNKSLAFLLWTGCLCPPRFMGWRPNPQRDGT